MPGFRIVALTVEGFKGITVPKEVDFDGRHVFLLGKNGNGKSTIVEAIRWGLFGSINRPNEVVTNRGYFGNVAVMLMLRRDNRQWTLKRKLIRGVSGGETDAVLTDENGKICSMREVIPRLDSANIGEGVYSIFSSQAAPLRRQPADLKPFERTVLNHIGLLRPQSLNTHLRDFLSEQEESENNLGQEIQKYQENIDDRLGDRLEERRRILRFSPWGDAPPPTIEQSEQKVHTLISEITGEPRDNISSRKSLIALIEKAEYSLKERREEDLGELRTRSAAAADSIKICQEHIENISKYNSHMVDVQRQEKIVRSVRERLDSISRGRSSTQLGNQVIAARKALEVVDLRSGIVENATQLLTHDEADTLNCPVCATNQNRHNLSVVLERQARELTTSEASRHFNELVKQFKRVQELERQVIDHQNKLANLNQTASYLANSLPKQRSLGHLKQNLEGLKKREQGINEQIAGNQKILNEMSTRLSELRDEGRFHTIEKELRGLRSTEEEFEIVKKSYHNLVSFGESVKQIHEAVDNSFTECLEDRLPDVSESLSQVFSGLTNHPYFDGLDFASERLPSLELQVLSSRDAQRRPHPPSVLNGQAESALELVPYFTFGQVEEASTDVHLLMLDDPTRAFDEDHIRILVERLAGLGRYVQLVVASQDTERFRALLPTHFEKGSYIIIRPTNWSYENGPELIIDQA